MSGAKEKEAQSAVLAAEPLQDAVDFTLAWDRVQRGTLPPISPIDERVCHAFVAMCYEVAEGPELEAEWFNYYALNFGKDHPARQLPDAFYVGEEDSGLVLRTNT